MGKNTIKIPFIIHNSNDFCVHFFLLLGYGEFEKICKTNIKKKDNKSGRTSARICVLWGKGWYVGGVAKEVSKTNPGVRRSSKAVKTPISLF